MTSSTAAMSVDGRGAGCATAGGMSTLRRLLSDILQSLQPTSTTASSRGSTSSRRRKDAMFSPFRERTVLDRFADQTVIDMYANRYSTADIYERALEILLENDSPSARNSPADWCDDVIDRRELNDRDDSGLQRAEVDTITGRRRPRCAASSAGMRSRSPGSDVESILDAVGDSTETYFGDVTLRRVFSLDAEVLQYVRDTPEVEYDVADESGSRVSLSSIDDCRQRGGRINEPDREFNNKTMGRAGTGCSSTAGAMSRTWTLPLMRKLTSAVGERLSRVLPGIRINRFIGDVPSPRHRSSTKDNAPQAAIDDMLIVDTFQPITCGSKNGPSPVTSSIDGNRSVKSTADKATVAYCVGKTDDAVQLFADVTSQAPASATHKAPTSNRASFSIADSEDSLSRVASSECSRSTSSTAPIRPSRSDDKLQSQLDVLAAGTSGEPELTSSSCCGDDDNVDASEVNSVDSDFARAISPAAAFDGARSFTGNGEVGRAENETDVEFDDVMTGTPGPRKYDHFDDSRTIDKTELMKYVIGGRSDPVVAHSTCPPSSESSKTAPGVEAGQAIRVDSVVERCQLSVGVDQLLPLSSDERSSYRTERVLVGKERDAAAGNRSPRNRPPAASQILQRRRDSAPICVDSRLAKIQTALRKSSADNCSPDASRKLPYNSAVDLRRLRLLRESCSTASRTSSCEVVIGDTDRDLVADFRSKSAAIARLPSCRRRRRPRRKSWCSASSASTTNDDDDDENIDETGGEEDESSGHHQTGYQLTKDIRCMRSSSTISVQSAAFGSETESACDAALDRQRDFLFDSLLVDRLRRMRTRRQFVDDGCDQVQMTSSYCDDDAASASAAGCDISDVENVADRATTWPPPPMTSTSCSSDADSSSCSSDDDVDVRVIDDDADATASGVDRLRRRQRFPRNSIGDDMSFLSSLDDDIVDSEATGDEFEITTGRGPCRGDVATTPGPNDYRAFRSHQHVSSSSGGVVAAVPELVSAGRIATKVELLTAPIAQTSVAEAHRATTRRIAKSAIV